ncbi:MAG TPA: LLM class flavin-dependent oxidoreductase [Nitrososphaerales archaeon]|nr:LLM class flavin-dependent oxidoreductase [Nitrososphaerales archaeon]
MPRTRSSKSFELALDIGENEKDPQEFKECVILAEKLGFDVAWLGDHFMPWAHSSNRSSYVWSLMGACLEASKKIRLGPYVTTPIGARYHPLIIAQAASTLDNMYPGRFVLTVGTGEAMNEAPFFGWPSWNERMERLVEGIQMIRKMWESKSYFDFDGKYFKANQIYLYTRPRTNMKIYVSGVGPKMARVAGEFGDGLITLSHANSFERCRDVIFPAFEEGVRSVGKDPSKVEKIVSLSFTFKDPETFARTERTYAGIVAKNSVNEPDPRKIEQMGREMPAEELMKSTAFLKNWDDVFDLIEKYRELGVTMVALNSGADKKLIRTFGQKVLPHYRKKK